MTAEAAFLTALNIARRQQAKSLELRAALSLSRLWRQHGKQEEARQLLSDIYGWFTEGFETADLQSVRRFLEGLTLAGADGVDNSRFPRFHSTSGRS